MKNLVLLLALLATVSIYAGQIDIKCVNKTDQVTIKNAAGSVAFGPVTGQNSYSYTYTDQPGVTYRVRSTLPTGEYLDKPFVFNTGTHTLCLSIASSDGFFETDRTKLQGLSDEIANSLQRSDGKLKEIEDWLKKAIKELQKKP